MADLTYHSSTTLEKDFLTRATKATCWQGVRRSVDLICQEAGIQKNEAIERIVPAHDSAVELTSVLVDIQDFDAMFPDEKPAGQPSSK